MAYEGALGRPLIALPGSLSRISPDQLAEFVQRHYVGGNMVVAGALLPPSLVGDMQGGYATLVLEGLSMYCSAALQLWFLRVPHVAFYAIVPLVFPRHITVPCK